MKLFSALLLLTFTSAQLRSSPAGLYSHSEISHQNHIALFGESGLLCRISTPINEQRYDYTLMLQFRMSEVASDSWQMLFEFGETWGPACWIVQNQELRCKGDLSLSLTQLPDLQAWLSLTYTSDASTGEQLVRIDQNGIFTHATSSEYQEINTNSVYLGISESLQASTAFQGDLREFYLSAGWCDQESIQAMMHSVKVFENQVMAYYQFDLEIGILADSFRNQKASIVSDQRNARAPMLLIDQGSRQICNSLDMNPFQSIPFFENGFESTLSSIPNFKFQQTGYTYSVSMWLRVQGTHSFSTNPKEGINDHHFFSLKNAFTIWFDQADSFRIYVYAQKNYQAQTTRSIQIPLKQWINVQLSIDQRQGLIVKVFNQNGKLVQETSIRDLQQQMPQNELEMLKNFRGEVKMITFWQRWLQLPISSTETDQDLLFRLDFEEKFYDGQKWESQSFDDFEVRATVEDGFYFHLSQVPDFNPNYEIPSQLGTFNTRETLYDGIGCSASRLNQILLKDGPLFNQFEMPKSTSMSAELWFKFREPAQSTGIINLLNTQSTEVHQQSLAVIIEDGVLKCAPYGQDGVPAVIFEGIDVVNELRWQHVSCAFEQSNIAIGQYLAYEPLSQEQIPYTFGVSLASYSHTTPNNRVKMDFTSRLGTVDYPIFFKDVRIWSYQRSIAEVSDQRFKQVDSMSTPSLVLNYKLLNGNTTIFNEAGTRLQAKGQSPELHEEGDLFICPSDKYFSHTLKGCVSNPLPETAQLLLFGQMTEQHGLQLELTCTSSDYPGTMHSWHTNDAAIFNSLVADQQTSELISLNPNTLGDGNHYEFTHTQTSSEHTFWQSQTQQFYPRKCQYLVFEEDHKPTKFVALKSVVDNLCINLKIAKADGCIDQLLNQFSFQDVSVGVVPALDGQIVNFGIDQTNLQVIACIPVNIMQAMATDQVYSFVFSANWQNLNDNDAAMSVSNAQLDLVVLSQINVQLQASAENVDIENSVVLDARSSLAADGTNKGLLYRWQCPSFLQQWCDGYLHSPVLEITSKAYKKNGGQIDETYDFTVQVWSIQLGTNPDHSVTQSKSLQLTWATFAPPIFTLELPLLYAQATPAILSSQEVLLTVLLENYVASDPRLQYTFDFQPASQYVSSLTVQSQNTLTLQEGSLRPGQAYILSITVQNTEKTDSVNFLEYSFETGVPPEEGTFTVLPAQGTMFETDFIMTLSNFRSNQPDAQLRFNVLGITSSSKVISIGASLQSISENPTQLPHQTLPLLEAVQLEVYDSIGERTVKRVQLTVARPAGQIVWSSVVQGITDSYSTQDVLEQKYLYFAFASQTCNSDFQEGTVEASDCDAAQLLMLEQAATDIQPIQADDSSQRAAQILDSILQMLQEVTLLTETQSVQASEWSIALIQLATGKIFPFDTAMKSSDFRTTFLQTISNILVYQTSIAEPLLIDSRRLSPQTNINALIILKNAFLDHLCAVEQDFQIRSGKIYTTTSLISLSDKRAALTVTNLLDQTQISVPLQALIAATDQESQWICLQVTFMQTTPVPGYQFQDLEDFQDTYIQVQSLDSKNDRVLEHGLTLSEESSSLFGQSALYEIKYQIDTLNNQEFKENRTMCMAYDANTIGAANWLQNGCQTVYSDSEITCQCLTLNNYFSSLINDFSRIVDEEFIPEMQFTWQFLIMLILLVFLLSILFIAVILDSQDQRACESGYKVTDQTIDYLSDQQGYKCQQVVYYKLKDVEKLCKLTQFGYFEAFSLLSLNMHPVLSFFYKFDYKIKRSTRATLLLLQVALITYMCLFLARIADGVVVGAAVFMFLVCAFTTLPVPSFVLQIISSDFTIEKPQSKKTPEAEGEVVIDEKCAILKYVIMALTAFVYIIELILVGALTTGYESSDQNVQSFRATARQAQSAFWVWLFSLSAGYLAVNMIRVAILTYFAQSKASQIYQLSRQQKIAIRTICAKEVKESWYFKIEPFEAVELCLDAYVLIDMVKSNVQSQPKTPQAQMTDQSHVSANNAGEDQTQDAMFETQAKNDAVSNDQSRDKRNQNMSTFRTVASAEITDLSARTGGTQNRQVPQTDPKLMAANEEQDSGDIDLDHDIRDEELDDSNEFGGVQTGAKSNLKLEQSQDSDDQTALPKSARQPARAQKQEMNFEHMQMANNRNLRRGVGFQLDPSQLQGLSNGARQDDNENPSQNSMEEEKQPEVPKKEKKPKKDKKSKKEKKEKKHRRRDDGQGEF